MNLSLMRLPTAACLALSVLLTVRGSEPTSETAAKLIAPKIPRFSTNYMDTSIQPGVDFYKYADGTWVRDNPVPPDKSRWGGFVELQERNWFLIHEILDEAIATEQRAGSPAREVADFFRSAMDTNRLEQLRFKPIEADL